jgi:GAF domain-containing protein
MNGTTQFLAAVSEEEKGQTRNVCNQVGYESVALIPIRSKDQILGLIQVADTREDKVPLNMVEALEKVGMQLGTAILRIQAEEEIKRRVEELNTAYEELMRFNNAMVGREIRMIELKKEINEMCERTGQLPRYPLEFEEEE